MTSWLLRFVFLPLWSAVPLIAFILTLLNPDAPYFRNNATLWWFSLAASFLVFALAVGSLAIAIALGRGFKLPDFWYRIPVGPDIPTNWLRISSAILAAFFLLQLFFFHDPASEIFSAFFLVVIIGTWVAQRGEIASRQKPPEASLQFRKDLLEEMERRASYDPGDQ